MPIHLVCRDCTAEGLLDVTEETAGAVSELHREEHPGHRVAFAEVEP